MSVAHPKIGEYRSEIRQLDANTVNRIAAGEVVERPASALKELVENALDADARRIDVYFADGGKTLIRVVDDGLGMAPDQLELALARHATSKIDGSDLLNIHTFGFRGEALASLGAVGKMSITSRVAGHPGAIISVNGGTIEPARPAALGGGTIVELRDIFYATPARLKFMRTNRAEAQAITNVIRRLAMAEPSVGFGVRDVSGGGEGRVVFRADPESGDMFDALQRRLAKVLGKDFAENSLRIDARRDGLKLTGFAALPTFSRGSALAQYLFVNGRPVRDKLLSGALRAAYFDYMHRGRHPAAALFIDCDPHLVDVNVHPAKIEVRFRDPGVARGLIVSALRHALSNAGHRASTTVSGATLGAFRPEYFGSRIYQMGRPNANSLGHAFDGMAPGFSEAPVSGRVEKTDATVEPRQDWPLGAARAQVHENYIIAQTVDGMVIVDQHAAHERLVYEKLKAQKAENGVASQALLIPEIIQLNPADATRLLAIADDLAGLGLVIEAFGIGVVAVQETPAILGQCDVRAMLLDIVDELVDQGESLNVQARIDAVLSRIACHGSIRSGRRMRGEEMNALLREMEATPHSGQCNHGRPTYVELKLGDIEKLFGRT